MNRAKEEADKLRNEAIRHLNSLLKIPDGFSCVDIDRFVDCTIGAAMLEVAAVQYDALNKGA